MTNQNAANFEERVVNLGSSFITNAQSAKLMQPTDGAFNHPTVHTQSTAVLGVAMRDHRLDADFAQGLSVGLRVVRAISIQLIKPKAWLAGFACNRRYLVDQWQQLCHVVSICCGHNRHDGYAVGIGEQMMFRPAFSAVGGAWAGQCAPPKARTVELSTIAREKSIWSAARRSSSSAR